MLAILLVEFLPNHASFLAQPQIPSELVNCWGQFAKMTYDNGNGLEKGVDPPKIGHNL